MGRGKAALFAGVRRFALNAHGQARGLLWVPVGNCSLPCGVARLRVAAVALVRLRLKSAFGLALPAALGFWSSCDH